MDELHDEELLENIKEGKGLKRKEILIKMDELHDEELLEYVNDSKAS